MRDAVLELLKSKNEVQLISVRPGEKFHESLIIKDEIRNTYENKEDYVIFEKQTQDHDILPEFKKSNLKEQYSSDRVDLLTKDELKQILIREKLVTT
jgi:UDP-N-acetylglucosamine 4,6-dehydratase/UDP-glucose 4-epimerase